MKVVVLVSIAKQSVIAVCRREVLTTAVRLTTGDSTSGENKNTTSVNYTANMLTRHSPLQYALTIAAPTTTAAAVVPAPATSITYSPEPVCCAPAAPVPSCLVIGRNSLNSGGSSSSEYSLSLK
jgi:hypothetical protein